MFAVSLKHFMCFLARIAHRSAFMTRRRPPSVGKPGSLVHSTSIVRRDDLLDMNDALQHPGRKVAVDLVTELPDEADIDLIKPVEGFLEAVSTGNLLLVTGEFKTRCVVECARCGGPLEVDVEYEMDEQFPVEGTPSSYAADDYAKIAAEEDFPLFEGNNLIVENLVRQGLLLNMPIQSLCKYGWDGDCPEAAALAKKQAAEQLTGKLGGLANLLENGGDEPA